jgi:tRNA G18 (ribose-2'-O)-methylase SpoU
MENQKERISQEGRFFGIGIEHVKTSHNVGTLWRSADLLGASFIYTIGRRYRPQITDTMKSYHSIPLNWYETFEDFYNHLPYDCLLIGVELDDRAVDLAQFSHPKRAVYLLGAEDHGLTKEAIKRCHGMIKLPGRYSMNVAVAGSIVMYDRATRKG